MRSLSRLGWTACLAFITALTVAAMSFGVVSAVADPGDTPHARTAYANEQSALKSALIKQIREGMASKTFNGHEWNKFMSAGNPDKFVQMVKEIDSVTIDPSQTARYVTSFWGTDQISLFSDPRTNPDHLEAVLHELLHRIQYVHGDDRYIPDQPGLTFGGSDNTLQKQYDERYTDYLEAMRGTFIHLDALEKAAEDGASVADLKAKWQRFESEYVAAIDVSAKYFKIDPKQMKAWCGLWFPNPSTIRDNYLGLKLPSGKGWTHLKTMLKADKASEKYAVQLTSLPAGYTLLGGAYVPQHITGSNPYIFDYTKSPWPKDMFGFNVDQEAYLGMETGTGDAWMQGSVTVKYRKGGKFPNESGYSYSSVQFDGLPAEMATARGDGVPGAFIGDVTTSILLKLPSGDGVSIRIGARPVVIGDDGGPAAQDRAAPLDAALVSLVHIRKGIAGAAGVSAASRINAIGAADEVDAGPRAKAAHDAASSEPVYTCSAPDVQGDMMVWEEYDSNSWNVYGRRNSGGGDIVLSTRAGDQRCPRVCGNTVVWYEESGTRSNIWAYDIPSGKARQITNQAKPQYEPAISWNRIVWSGYNSGNWDIYTYDCNTGKIKRLTTDKHAQLHPQISQIPGSNLSLRNDTYRIIWRDQRNGEADIYLYDMSKGAPNKTNPRRLMRLSANENDPVIDGNLVVWKDTRNGLRGDIYYLDLKTGKTTCVTKDVYSQSAPDVSNGRIVWTDNRDGDGDIYCYTVATKTLQRITSEPIEQDSPRIDGTTIVWRENSWFGSLVRRITLPAPVQLTKPVAPASAAPKAVFSVTGSITPSHTGCERDIRIVVRKWDAGKKLWSYYGNILTDSYTLGGVTQYSASLSLDNKGRYALQAVHPGCQNAGYGTSGNTIAGWAQVTVN